MIIENIDKYIEDRNIKKIFLDVDGVLLHSCQAMCDILNEMQGTDFIGADVFSWNFKEICPDLTDEEMEYLFETDDFFYYVEFIKGAIDFIKRHEDDVIIVTKSKLYNYINKRMLFDRVGLKNIPIIPLPLNVSKRVIDMSDALFIDDNANNLYESNAEYKIQFREYNDNLNHKREWIKDWNGNVMYKW